MSSNIRRSLGLESNIPEEGRPLEGEGEQAAPAATTEPAPTPEPTAAPAPAPADGSDPAATPAPAPEPTNEPVDDEPADLQEGEVVNTQLADATLAEADVQSAIVTLESIVDVLSQASEDQLNETTAAIVAAAIDDIDGRFDIEQAVEISTEGYRMLGSSNYRQTAVESLKSKVETLKETAKKIVDKIIELIQRFWQWLTLNKKRVQKRVEAAQASLKGISGDAEVKTSPLWRTVAGQTFDAASVIKNGRTLEMAAMCAAVFVASGFEAVGHTGLRYNGHSSSYIGLARKAFANFNETAGVIQLYSNIGGRSVSVELAADDDTYGKATSPFKIVFAKVEQDNLPESVKLTEHDVDTLMKQTQLTLDASVKGYEKIERTVNMLKRFAATSRITSVDPMAIRGSLLRSYASALSGLTEACFMQSLRYANVASQIVERYVAAAKGAEQQTGNNNTPLMSA